MLDAFIIEEWEREQERRWSDGALPYLELPLPLEPPPGYFEEEEVEDAGHVIVIDMT